MLTFFKKLIKYILRRFNLYHLTSERAHIAYEIDPAVGKIALDLDLKRAQVAFELTEQELPLAPYVNQLTFSTTQSGYYGKTKVKRSVVFLNNSYYHFYYLAQALRRRDWDVITISVENPASRFSGYYHGEDINFFHPERFVMNHNIKSFFNLAKKRYKLLHFAGDYAMSFFPENFPQDDPEDIIEWKSAGNKVACTISGCNSATKQTSYAQWTREDHGMAGCDYCVWQNNSATCSDEKSMRWGRKIEKYCDIIFAETLPSLDYLAMPKVIHEPLSMCLDPVVWSPELIIPDEYKIARRSDELIIYHAVGEYDSRTRSDGTNIKGTNVIKAVISRLKSEGFPVRLVFVTEKRNKEARYIQAQADIIADQLYLGTYGAVSREGMMLGKPVICYLNRLISAPHFKLKSLSECPIVSADANTFYEVLKDLIINKEKRKKIGQASREYALKWHSADACAERYEQVYDNLIETGSVFYPKKWRYYEVKPKEAFFE